MIDCSLKMTSPCPCEQCKNHLRFPLHSDGTMASMDTTAPSPPPPTAEFRHKVYMDENGVETTLLERRKVRMRRIASDAHRPPKSNILSPSCRGPSCPPCPRTRGHEASRPVPSVCLSIVLSAWWMSQSESCPSVCVGGGGGGGKGGGH